MSDMADSHLTSEDGDDTSKDIMTFCMQLVHHSQWKSIRRYTCGSQLDFSYNSTIAQILPNLGITTDGLDLDIMVIDTASRCAVHRYVSLPETYTGDVIRIYTDEVHTGYARLMNENRNTELQLNDFCKMTYIETRHGPAVMSSTKEYLLVQKYSHSNDVDDAIEYRKHTVPFQDAVYAVHCPYWPVEATEWITRRRARGFPAKSVIKQILRYGCDFVQVSHNRHGNDNEWRFSFSRAELFTSKSWSISQRIVYIALWVLNKKIVSSKLCSYYFKTLVFWACEEKSSEFWRDDLLVHTIRELLIIMTKCVKSKFCVNYFIPGNNMMDHMIDTDLSYEIKILWRFLQSAQFIADLVRTFQRCELILGNTILHLELPSWIKRSFVIFQRVENDYANYSNLFSTNLSQDLQNALYSELSNIYRGLWFQQKSMNCVNVPDKHSYLLNSESHLLLAVNLCDSQDICLMDNCGWKFSVSVGNCFMTYAADDTYDAFNVYDNNKLNTKLKDLVDNKGPLNDHKKHMCLMYSRRHLMKQENKLVKNAFNKTINEGGNVKFLVYLVTTINTFTKTEVKFCKEWPGRSPTVNVSWFIAKAYLANFYYRTQRDVSLAITTCDDIIDVYRQSEMNLKFAERIFPVLLSTQWTSIYDKEIQELLGFYSLCSYVFDPSCRAVYLGVCPVQFALYLKLRLEGEPLFRACTINDRNRSSYFNHIKACLGNIRVNCGRWLLTNALYNHSLQ